MHITGGVVLVACLRVVPAGKRESVLDLCRRTVKPRRPERARNEGSTGPKGLG